MHRCANSFTVHPFRKYLSLFVLLLAGCSSPPPVPDYTRSPIEYQLMAEIALQRGDYLVSAQQYLKLAQESRDPEFAQRATELAYDYGFDAYALASAERWVQLAPDDAVAHAYLGRLYVRRNRLDKAWASLNIALGSADQRTDMDYMVLSGDLSEGADPRRGLSLFQRFKEENPEVAGITASIATLAAEAGDLDAAVTAARETVVLAPEWTGARIWLARLLLANGQRSSAFEQMAFALEMEPGLELELEFIELVAAAGAYDDALERLARLDTRFPDSPELLRTRAIIYLQTDDLERAQDDFAELVASAYFVNECFWYLGQIAFQQGEYLQAIRYFERVSSGGWLVPAKLGITQAYLGLGDADSALRVQRDFAANYPKQAFETLQPQAEILLSMNQVDEALATMAVALEYRPWDPELWLYRGGIYENTGDYAEAIKAFRRAVELAPESATALNALGYTLTIATRDYAEAYDYVSRAIALEPDNAAIMDSMGWVLYKQGERDEALAWLEKAYGLLSDPELAAHLGEVLWVDGDEEGAMEIWSAALQEFPDSRALMQTIDRFTR
jgi:tetratricopeptide (TPR) repeat protein